MVSKLPCPGIQQETMNVMETAVFLGISYNHCADMIAAGEIPHRKLGKRVLTSRTVLIEWLKGKES